MAQKIIVAYIPVIHQGYRRLFDENPTYRVLYLLDKGITSQFRELQKEIRALDPTQTRQALKGWACFDEIKIIDETDLSVLQESDVEILMPDDDISHTLEDRYFVDKAVKFSPVFLRWDRRNSQVHNVIDPDAVISEDELAKKMLSDAQQEGLKSSNIWRRVGAVLAKDGEIIASSSNRHRPTQYSPWIDGDVRANFNKGTGIEMSTDQHAESCVIAEAARCGVGVDGADLYVDTFPCPPCAMLVAYSGVKRLFYADGYAVLDGLRVMRTQEVAVYKVTLPEQTHDDASYVVYPNAPDK